MENLFSIISKNISSDNSCSRLFHGRGNRYLDYEHIVVDFYPPVLLITLYKDKPNTEEFLQEVLSFPAENILVQKRYLPRPEWIVLKGALPNSSIAQEGGMKFELALGTFQNIGFFLDMARGREWLLKNSKDKRVLNLFSYTCSLSVAALKGGAYEVYNFDMSKAALSVGQKNHRLNDIDQKKVKFMPFDIMKSWSKVTKPGPYDIIIIDPPTNQGDSFKVERDYYKIVKRLSEMTSENAIVLACLNSPYLKSDFLAQLFSEHASGFEFLEIIPSAFAEMEIDVEAGLKILLFKKRGG